MKYLKMLLLLIIAVPFFFVAIYHYLPVSYDAGACGGGFNTYIYNKNIKELTEIYKDTNSLDTVITHSDNYTVDYEGRNIYITTFLSYEKDSEVYREKVSFKGKRIWTEKYMWKLIQTD